MIKKLVLRLSLWYYSNKKLFCDYLMINPSIIELSKSIFEIF